MFELRDYQNKIVNDILNNKCWGVFLNCGLGKTLITLEAIYWLKQFDNVKGVLIVAPKQIINEVWQQEAKKWGYDFTFSILPDDPDKTDIYFVTPESLISPRFKLPDANMLIIDESTKFKNHSSKRFKILQKYLNHFDRRLILTGTPMPRGYLNLWPQVFILDQGQRLGKTITAFRTRYFNRGGYMNYEYKLIEGSDKKIIEKTQNILKFYEVLSILFPSIENDIAVYLDDDSLDIYKRFSNKALLELQDTTLIAYNHMTKRAKLKQLISGACYDEDGIEVLHLSTRKVNRLTELVESLQEEPLIIVYNYNFEINLIEKALDRDLPRISGNVHAVQIRQLIKKWNNREVSILLIQPQAAAHGINLQDGGHNICWFSATYDLELYLQTNSRLCRSGQNKTVVIHRLITQETLEPVIYNALSNKRQVQDELLQQLSIN